MRLNKHGPPRWRAALASAGVLAALLAPAGSASAADDSGVKRQDQILRTGDGVRIDTLHVRPER
ncbi:hypothetical protein [Streptomyces rutgersensis]|uniref:hypothetical protein n=1 Tax=Streptomyces rutgersensis TaxID=53451 RepID=UPI0018766970|nr:hypothetical protein [Streptomyces rutgersensis]